MLASAFAVIDLTNYNPFWKNLYDNRLSVPATNNSEIGRICFDPK